MNNINSLFPDFLIIGAGKSGTTSIDNYLKQHPEIFISPKKEPNFFAYELTDIASLGKFPDEIKHYQDSITTLEEYKKLFVGANPGQIKGETSNTYLYGKDAPYRIKYHIPNVKLIAILRQPAERLYSRYLHLYRENELPTPHFSDCRDKNTIWWERNDLINEGFYYKHISRYFELFPKENIKVFLYEDIKNDLKGMLKDIFTFIDVDNTFECDLSVRYNESGIIKNKAVNKLIGGNGYILSLIKKIAPHSYESIKDNLTAQKLLNKLRSKNLDKPKIDPEIKHFLTNEVYKEDILQLQALINKDLSSWIK